MSVCAPSGLVVIRPLTSELIRALLLPLFVDLAAQSPGRVYTVNEGSRGGLSKELSLLCLVKI